MPECIICKNEKDNLIKLSNGSYVHKQCEETLYQEILNTQENENLKLLQKYIYDYWFTYPPDWSSRKEKIKSEKKSCDKCGKVKFKKNDYLEVHHIIPIRDGGSHKDNNLELLCKNCHKIEHLKNPHKFRKKKKSNI